MDEASSLPEAKAGAIVSILQVRELSMVVDRHSAHCGPLSLWVTAWWGHLGGVLRRLQSVSLFSVRSVSCRNWAKVPTGWSQLRLGWGPVLRAR